MPRKCNLQGLRSLLEECKKKNKEGQGDQFSNNDLRNMLPYNLTTLDEGEEKNGLCNNVKIDSYSVDKTFEIWQKIWNEHSEDLDEVARISNMTIKNEKEYLDETEAARDNYIHSINKFEEINSKKNCYLQGKDFVGIGNGSDGGDCGDQLPYTSTSFINRNSIPKCLVEKDKINLFEQKVLNYLIIGCAVVFFLFFVYKFILKK